MGAVDEKLVIMAVSAGIALMSLLLSLFSAHLTRVNTRLSVRPKLTFYDNWYEQGGVLGIYIKNNGPGMAEIVSMRIYWDDQEIKYQKNAWERFLVNARIEKKKVFYQLFLKNDAMASGESLPLLFYKDSEDKKGLELFKRTIREHLTIKITYSSIHNVKYTDVFGNEK